MESRPEKREARREAKKTIMIAKNRAWDELYQELETTEEDRDGAPNYDMARDIDGSEVEKATSKIKDFNSQQTG